METVHHQGCIGHAQSPAVTHWLHIPFLLHHQGISSSELWCQTTGWMLGCQQVCHQRLFPPPRSDFLFKLPLIAHCQQLTGSHASVRTLARTTIWDFMWLVSFAMVGSMDGSSLLAPQAPMMGHHQRMGHHWLQKDQTLNSSQCSTHACMNS